MGAEVIKIERPDGGDFARQYDSAAGEVSSWFVWANRGKKSLTLDMKSPLASDVMAKLLTTADIFIQNLAPGAAERLGLGAEKLAEHYPHLITASITGYGEDGPYRDRKAYDLLLQGEGGVFALTGDPTAPTKAGISVSDISAGLYAFSSITLALLQRGKTGKGCHIETSLFDGTVEWSAPYLYNTMYSGKAPSRSGSRHNVIVPYGLYQAKDGRVNLAVQNEEQWRKLCTGVLKRPELARHPDYSSNELRMKHRMTLDPLIETIFSDYSVTELEQLLSAADVPFGRVNELPELAQHPQLRQRGRFHSVQVPGGNTVEVLSSPLGWEGLPERLDPVPALGEHTAKILKELGLG
jgi:crotonobetainyl-CoA:carnitine CoA-transferase CaiB-like acyl-CoA transferase